MSRQIPVTSIDCRACGETAPQDAHFCPNCEHILSLRHHGDYFAFMGLPRRLQIDPVDLERRFRDLSRRLHPDYFYNATPAERLASLQRSSYLNDAYRTLKQLVSRSEYLLNLEGYAATKPGEAGGTVPPGLLEEVFELNEQLDEIRRARESGADPAVLGARLAEARRPIEAKREAHERELAALAARWDALLAGPVAGAARNATLEALRERVLERNYINNLLGTIEKEEQALDIRQA